MLDFNTDRTVLLFFEDFETDRFVSGDRHVKRALRKLYHRVTSGQKTTGFQTWFELLTTALERADCDVRIGDHRLARQNPDYPVGLCGYPHIVDGWKLPNPAVLGPGLFDHPSQVPDLLDDPRFASYIVTCDWTQKMFAEWWGDACVHWHAGIDLSEWPDLSTADKSVDVLIYDKVRWQREHYEPKLIEPVLADLEQRGLSYEVVRYGHYGLDDYRSALRRSRSMLFFCEHETQGMAYQEALACNVPVVAWDNGFWLDPRREEFEKSPVPASSVPFFGPPCGATFTDAAAFGDVFDRFWSELAGFEPRAWVAENLSMESSATAYLAAYTSLLP